MATETVSESDTPEQFVHTVDQWVLITYKNVNNLLRHIAADLFSSVIKDTPVLTGRAKNNWVFSAGSEPVFKNVGPTTSKKLLKYNFDKSGDKATKRVINGIRRAPPMLKNGIGINEYYLTNQVPYIRKLEYGLYKGGYSKQAPGGMARQNVQRAAHMTLTHVNKSRGKV